MIDIYKLLTINAIFNNIILLILFFWFFFDRIFFNR